MSANTLPVKAATRKPRGLIEINGISVPWLTFSVDSNVFFTADSFRVTLPYSALPGSMSIDVLFSTADLFVEVFAGFPANADSFTKGELKSLIYGKADEVSWEASEGIIEIGGRDLTAEMIDIKTTAKYPNLVSSAIVTQIAASHGLTPQVTKTSIPVGKFYEQDHVKLQSERSEWDLITFLAQQEGFVAFVQGKTLYFQPAPTADQTPYTFFVTPGAPYVSNTTAITFEHQKTLAKDIIVTVKSYNHKTGRAVSATAKASHTKSAVKGRSPISTGTPQTYVRVIPNLDKGGCLRAATALLTELSKHEIKLQIDGPADDILERTDAIKVVNTAGPVNIAFFPSSIERSMSFDGGYSWRIEAKNHATESQSDV